MAEKQKVARDRRSKKEAPDPKVAQKEQSKRFIETARMIEADESGAEFDKAFDAAVRRKRYSP